MNIEELDALMEQTTKQFNELKVEEGTTRARLDQIDTGLKQLQGEFEAYKTLKNALVERASTPAQEDPAILLPDPFKSKKTAEKEVERAAK